VPAADLLLALGAFAIHRSRLEAALFQPLPDLVFREADIRFDPRVRYESAPPKVEKPLPTIAEMPSRRHTKKH
jgi:hypothetical protein